MRFFERVQYFTNLTPPKMSRFLQNTQNISQWKSFSLLKCNNQVNKSTMTPRMIPEIAFEKGSSCPVLKPDTLRLYSMRFCPFVQRTRLVLSHKKIQHEIVNIDLSNKPDWFLNKTTLGLVPVLEYNDSIVFGSEICGDYLDEIHPQKKLNSSNCLEFAKERMDREYFTDVPGSFYKFRNLKSEEDLIKLMNKFRKSLRPYESMLAQSSGNFIKGCNLTMLDFHLWPWFERMPAIAKLTGHDILQPFPNLKAWCATMRETIPVKETCMSEELHMRFIMSHIARKPDFNAGLEEQIISKL